MAGEEEGVRAKKAFEQLKNTKPSRNGNYLGEKEGKFFVALSAEEVYELSPLAYYVWLLCDGEHTVAEIADRMSKDLSLSIDEVIEPLVLALNGLSNVNLVVIKPKEPQGE